MDVWQLILVPAAFGASLLTFISGFGLGTLLLPVFALFLPLPTAVAMTAVVHLLNNLFKFGLLWRSVERAMVLRFGLPSIVGAFAGAVVLERIGRAAPLYLGLRTSVDVLDLVIAALMILFSVLELSAASNRVTFGGQHLVPGGLISGFFGGLSGHQGALRSMFLLRSGVKKEAYIATGIAIALLVDLTRLPIYYAGGADLSSWSSQWPLLLATVLAAFAGAWWGKWLLPKVTHRGVQVAAGALMVVIGAGLAIGLI